MEQSRLLCKQDSRRLDVIADKSVQEACQVDDRLRLLVDDVHQALDLVLADVGLETVHFRRLQRLARLFLLRSVVRLEGQLGEWEEKLDWTAAFGRQLKRLAKVCRMGVCIEADIISLLPIGEIVRQAVGLARTGKASTAGVGVLVCAVFAGNCVDWSD